MPTTRRKTVFCEEEPPFHIAYEGESGEYAKRRSRGWLSLTRLPYVPLRQCGFVYLTKNRLVVFTGRFFKYF